MEQIRSTDWVTHDVAPDLVPREAQRRMQAIQTELPNVHFVQHTLHPDPLIEARLDQELYFIYGWLPSQNSGEILQLTENAGHLVPFPIKND